MERKDGSDVDVESGARRLPGAPSAEEAQQLRKLKAAAVRRARLGRLFVLANLLFLIYTYIAGVPNAVVIGIYVVVLLCMTYVTLVMPLLTPCPRCRRRMTLLKGRCVGCGLSLGPG